MRQRDRKLLSRFQKASQVIKRNSEINKVLEEKWPRPPHCPACHEPVLGEPKTHVGFGISNQAVLYHRSCTLGNPIKDIDRNRQELVDLRVRIGRTLIDQNYAQAVDLAERSEAVKASLPVLEPCDEFVFGSPVFDCSRCRHPCWDHHKESS